VSWGASSSLKRGSSRLEFGVRLAAGLVVDVVVRCGAGLAHRRTALMAPRHLGHDVVLRGDGGRLSTTFGKTRCWLQN
jgi:hypothetical protein